MTLLRASVPHLAVAADEIVAPRVRGDGWTVQQLDSEQATRRNATIRRVLDGLTYVTELGAVRIRRSRSRGGAYAEKNSSLEFEDASGDDKKVSIPFPKLAAASGNHSNDEPALASQTRRWPGHGQPGRSPLAATIPLY